MDIRYLFGIIVCRRTKLNSRRPAMSSMSIAPYFPFCRIRITDQFVYPQGHESWLRVVPDKRFQPICYLCGQKALCVHSWGQRRCPASEFGFDPSLSALPFSKNLLPGLRTDCYRRFGDSPSLFSSHQTTGLIYSRSVPSHDRQGGRRTSGPGLENR